MLTKVLAVPFIIGVFLLAGCGNEQPLMLTSVETIKIGMTEDNLVFEMPMPEWLAKQFAAIPAIAAPSSGTKLSSVKPTGVQMQTADGPDKWVNLYVLIASGGFDNQYLPLEVDWDARVATGSARMPVGTAIFQAFYEEDYRVIFKSEKKTLEIVEGTLHFMKLTMYKVAKDGSVDIMVTWSDEEIFEPVEE